MRNLARILVPIFLILGPGLTWAEVDVDDLKFHLPSTFTLSGTSSNAGTKTGGAAIHLMLPGNYWINGAADQAVEETDGLETKTLGGSISIGTDPLDEFSVDFGFDGSTVESQYRVQEGRLRVAVMPDSVFSLNNPGLEMVIELRAGRFSFANSPNPVFQTNEVQLESRTARFELGWYGSSPWTFRLWTEQVQLADGFKELNRPLAPLFIPLTAISTGLGWPREEWAGSLGYSKNRWSARLQVSKKRAFVTDDKTITYLTAGDFKWTRRLTSGVRISTAVSDGGSVTSDPINTLGADLGFSF